MNKISADRYRGMARAINLKTIDYFVTSNKFFRLIRKCFFHLAIFFGIVFIVACEKSDPDILAGEAIVNKTCKACHAGGLNNAPILGNKKMWGPRVDQGLDTLVKHAVNGYELMPAKGGNEALNETEIRQAIKYMLSLLEE